MWRSNRPKPSGKARTNPSVVPWLTTHTIRCIDKQVHLMLYQNHCKSDAEFSQWTPQQNCRRRNIGSCKWRPLAELLESLEISVDKMAVQAKEIKRLYEQLNAPKNKGTPTPAAERRQEVACQETCAHTELWSDVQLCTKRMPVTLIRRR